MPLPKLLSGSDEYETIFSKIAKMFSGSGAIPHTGVDFFCFFFLNFGVHLPFFNVVSPKNRIKYSSKNQL